MQILGSIITPLAREFGLLGADGSVAAGPYSAIWVLWFVGLLIGATVFGWLTDRVGRRRLFVVTLVLYAAATLATAFAPSFAVFLIFRFVTALGVGGEYAAYYGLFTFVAAYVLTTEQIGIDTATVPVFNLVANLGALAGGIAVAVVLDRVGRAPTVVGAYSGAAATSVLLALAALTGSAALTMVAFALAAFAATCCWISAYVTFAELFATPVRATGVGLCVGAGRLGGMLGVVGLSFTTSVIGLLPAFLLLAAFFAVGAIAGLLWRSRGVEGRNQALDDVAPWRPVSTG